jgi:PiT family inorganic phosphate transporter
VLVAVSFGLFTSMNQALVGGMTGAGVARGRNVVHTGTLLGIVRGWFTGPPSAFLLAFAAAVSIRAIRGADSLAH